MDAEPSHGTERPRPRSNLWFGVLLVIGAGLLYAYTNRPIRMPAGWGEDLAAARERAARENLPILIDFAASWCSACQAMAREVLPDPRVADVVKGFVAVKVDVSEHREIAAEYGVNPIPLFVVLKPNGEEVHRFVGYRTPDAFIAELAKARERIDKPGA